MSSAPRFMLWPVVCLSLWLGYMAGHRATPPLPTVPDSLRVQQVRLETLYRQDTQVFWRTKTRWDTVVLLVDRWKTDTLQVVEYIQLADSSLRACASALRTCEQRVTAERAISRALRGELARQDAEARKAKLQWGLAGSIIGALGYALLRP